MLRCLLTLLDLGPEDTLVFLGDYLDRGEDSVGTVRALLALARTAAYSCIFLRGNHDAAWLEDWDTETARFVERPAIPGSRALWEAWANRGGVPSEVGRFLESTVTAYEDDYAYYVHVAARPGVPFWQTPRRSGCGSCPALLGRPMSGAS